MNHTTKKRTYLIGLLIFISGVALDQFTKYMACTHLKGKEAVVLMKNVFELRYLENRGAAFGMFQGQKYIFLIIGVLMLLAGTYFYVRMPFERRYSYLRYCIICIMTGAVGNMIDRVFYNYVVDFFYFSLIDFPIFNVADIYVTVTTVILLLLILFYYKEEDLDMLTSLVHSEKGNLHE